MTGPKHLWSGDWQAESRDPSPEPGRPVRPVDEPSRDPVRVRQPVRPMWQTILPAAIVLLVVAVALAEVLPGGSSGRTPRGGATTPSASVIPNSTIPSPNSPGTSTVPATTPGNTISGRTVVWLGMRISTENEGAVVQTVQLGSPADAAGLDPGDIIQTVNRHTITAAGQIPAAVRDLKRGDAVAISVDRGSTLFSTLAAFAGHPTFSP